MIQNETILVVYLDVNGLPSDIVKERIENFSKNIERDGIIRS